MNGLTKQRSSTSLPVSEISEEEEQPHDDFIKELRRERQLFKEQMTQERQKLKDLLEDAKKNKEDKPDEGPTQERAPQTPQTSKKCTLL